MSPEYCTGIKYRLHGVPIKNINRSKINTDTGGGAKGGNSNWNYKLKIKLPIAETRGEGGRIEIHPPPELDFPTLRTPPRLLFEFISSREILILKNAYRRTNGRRRGKLRRSEKGVKKLIDLKISSRGRENVTTTTIRIIIIIITTKKRIIPSSHFQRWPSNVDIPPRPSKQRCCTSALCTYRISTCSRAKGFVIAEGAFDPRSPSPGVSQWPHRPS